MSETPQAQKPVPAEVQPTHLEKKGIAYREQITPLPLDCIAETHSNKNVSPVRVVQTVDGLELADNGVVDEDKLFWIISDVQPNTQSLIATQTAEVVNPEYNGRAILLSTGLFIDKTGQIFTVIGIKGVTANITREVKPEFYVENPDTPLGLIGEKTCELETKFSELARVLGVRANSVITYAVLEPGKFKEFLLSIQKGYYSAEIDKITKTGERPALLARAMGGHRLEAVVTAADSGRKVDVDVAREYTTQAAIALATEAQQDKDKFAGILSDEESKKLGEFLKETELTREHWEVYAKLLFSLHYRNHSLVAGYNLRSDTSQSFYPNYKPQDLDLTGRVLDFETQDSKQAALLEKMGRQGLVNQDLQNLDNALNHFSTGFSKIFGVSQEKLQQIRLQSRSRFFSQERTT